MNDTLSLLRQYNVNGKPITQENDYIIFDEFAWPKTVKTKYLVTRPKNDKTSKEYYTLESLLYFLNNASLRNPDYFHKAAAENIPAVRRPDRKKLLAYLNGENNTSPNIDESAPSEIPTSVKREADDQNQQEVIKKPKLEDHNETSLPKSTLLGENTNGKGINLQCKQERDQPAS